MNDDPIYTLRYPVWFSFLSFLMGTVGVLLCVDWFWISFLPFSQEDLLPKFHLFLLLLAPVGIGLSIMQLESIVVSKTSIESRWLGRRKRLELSSARILKKTQNYYVLQDELGQKLLVRTLLEHSGLLLSDIEEQTFSNTQGDSRP